jgi:hypothetical protein
MIASAVTDCWHGDLEAAPVCHPTQ